MEQPPEPAGQAGQLLHGAGRFYALGVYIRQEQLSGVVVDVDGNTVRPRNPSSGHSIALRLDDSDVDTVVRGAAQLSDELIGSIPESAEVLGLGVTLSGQVEAGSGTVRRSHRMGWDEPVDLSELLRGEIGLPTMIQHDVAALTLAEQMFGLGQGRRSFAVVTAGRGIGAGLVIDYQLWRGMSGTAGELGHTVIAESAGRRCGCGNYGCLETVAGSEGILRTLQASNRSGLESLDDAVRLARQGDETARRAFESAGRALGKGLASLVNLLNLELVVVRAERALQESVAYENAVRWAFAEHGFYEATQLCELKILERDHQLGARSAGSMVLRLLPDRLAANREHG